jgi:uncharacterized protein
MREGKAVKSKLLNEGPVKTYAVILDKGDEIKEEITQFARENGLKASSLTAIGALQDATLGYFDREKMDYRRIPVREQTEVVSLVGDIAINDEEPQLHAHVVLSRADGSTFGGHFFEGHVWPTLEVIVTESPGYLAKTKDEETGLALIDLDH